MKHVSDIIKIFVTLFLTFVYLAGIILAKGFWSTTCALFPGWSFYLVVEKVLKLIGWI